MPLLDDESFHATFRDMRNVTEDADPAVDIWPYVGRIPRSELGEVRPTVGFVDVVYRTGDGRFDHVLVPTDRANVYLAVVVSRIDRSVFGHHVLDLNEKYGLELPPVQLPPRSN